jgi:hypothetical protein
VWDWDRTEIAPDIDGDELQAEAVAEHERALMTEAYDHMYGGAS